MKLRPYDPPSRWLVSSESLPGLWYLVDLSEREICPHGICGCHDFDLRVWCPLLAKASPQRLDCKHLRFTVRALTRRITRKKRELFDVAKARHNHRVKSDV